jgi:hypothetical protein
MTVRAVSTLIGHVIVGFVAIAWCWLGLWIKLLGFSVYHSRGDVWLPTPPAASAYFHRMVLIGTLAFVLIVLLVSTASLFLRLPEERSQTTASGSSNYAVFRGDAYRLSVRYFALLLSVFLSPYFYNFMWRFQGSLMFRIAGGLAITLVAFIVVLLFGKMLTCFSSKEDDSRNTHHSASSVQ